MQETTHRKLGQPAHFSSTSSTLPVDTIMACYSRGFRLALKWAPMITAFRESCTPESCNFPILVYRDENVLMNI